MRIDRNRLDAQINVQRKRLELLEQIASDPELLPMLESVLVMNGAGPVVANKPPAKDLAPKKKGYVLAAIAAAALRRDKPFSGYELATIMQNEGFKFESANHGVSVTEALRSLAAKKEPVVRITRKGKGSEPTLFERILR